MLDRYLDKAAQPEPDHYLLRAQLSAAGGHRELPAAIAGLDQGIRKLGPVVTLETRALDLEEAQGNWSAALARVDRLVTNVRRPDQWLERRAQVLDCAGRPDEARRARQQGLALLEALPAALRDRPDNLKLRQRLSRAVGRKTGGHPKVADR